MPKTKSAKKALRQTKTRQARNLKTKDGYKRAIKAYRKLIAGKDIEKAKTELPKIFQVLDKAAKNKAIKPNKASRLKSRLSKKLKAA